MRNERWRAHKTKYPRASPRKFYNHFSSTFTFCSRLSQTGRTNLAGVTRSQSSGRGKTHRNWSAWYEAGKKGVSCTIFHRCIDVTSRNAIRKIIEDRLNRFELQPSNDSPCHVFVTRLSWSATRHRTATLSMKILPEILLIIVASFDASLDTFSLSLKKKKKKKKKKGREKENSDRKETLRCYIFEIGKTTLPALIQFSLDSILVE